MWGRREFSIIQGNKAEKVAPLIPFLSLMHATICMDIADAEMHMVERFLTPSSTTTSASFIFFSLSASPSFTTPDYSHLKISKILVLHLICFILLFKIYSISILLCFWFLFFLVLCNFLFPHSLDIELLVYPVVLQLLLAVQKCDMWMPHEGCLSFLSIHGALWLHKGSAHAPYNHSYFWYQSAMKLNICVSLNRQSLPFNNEGNCKSRELLSMNVLDLHLLYSLSKRK